ncbi:hypothetical protein LNI88_11610 [Tenacibaculum dicentrarchi]|nr:hypothetical protein [Tenacibaculum dicentrarchi]
MKEEINETVLSVLRKNKKTNQIVIDYVNFENPLSKEILEFEKACDNTETKLEELILFIKNNPTFNQLTTHYRYCCYLNGSYQAFSAKNQDTITDINNKKKLILFNAKNKQNYNIKKKIEEFKQELKLKYQLWVKAYSINKTYRICNEDKSIIAFSHRIDGWSKPLYQLTPNFSLEIKTNFGFGRASYFYTKLKYKDIEITPFSEWINYEFADFSEIVRYTQSHLLRNEYWLEAMTFSKDACNLSTTNEVKFVEKYIIDECEEMVKGLEEIFHKEHFSFKDREKPNYKKDKKGHVLVEFRGEKISGALDFISKILEFKEIASIQTFIDRIEINNKKIHPILEEEAKIIKIKLSNFIAEKDELKPKYDNVIEENNSYNKKKAELQRLMIANGKLDLKKIDVVRLNKEFLVKYPEYEYFKKEHKSITENYRLLTEQIMNLTKVYNNINTYREKIFKYFKK